MGWRRFAFRSYLALQRVDAALLEPRLPPPSSTPGALGAEARRVSGRTQYYCATSLDGFIAEADDTLEWLTGYDGASTARAPSP